MAVGLNAGAVDRTYKIIEGATAVNNAPSGASAGISINDFLSGRKPEEFTVAAFTTAASGTATFSLKLWGFNRVAQLWAPIGVHATAATKGLLNGGNAIGETSSDVIAHTERIEFSLAAVSRIYVEITAITTSTVDVYIVIADD